MQKIFASFDTGRKLSPLSERTSRIHNSPEQADTPEAEVVQRKSVIKQAGRDACLIAMKSESGIAESICMSVRDGMDSDDGH